MVLEDKVHKGEVKIWDDGKDVVRLVTTEKIFMIEDDGKVVIEGTAI